jgi:hypothetical protein
LKAIEATLKRIEELLKCQTPTRLETSPLTPYGEYLRDKEKIPYPKEPTDEPSVVYTDPTAQFLDEARSKLGLKHDDEMSDVEVSYSVETPTS